VAVVFLAAVGVVGGRLLSANDKRTAGGSSTTVPPATTPATTDPDTTTTTDSSGPTETVTPDPTTVATASGIVAIAPAVTDPRAPAVAQMFNVYFSGINDKNYTSVGTVLDPNGSVDPTSPKQMKALSDGTKTTVDSNVTLTSLHDAASGLLTAEVTFRSTQDPGDGPRERPAETCTRWDVTYTVSAGDAYRIRKSKAHSAPC
jgi:hypothetical protein